MVVPAEVVSELTKVTKALLPLQAGRCKLVCDTYSSNIIPTSTSSELLSSTGRDEISNRLRKLEASMQLMCHTCEGSRCSSIPKFRYIRSLAYEYLLYSRSHIRTAFGVYGSAQPFFASTFERV